MAGGPDDGSDGDSEDTGIVILDLAATASATDVGKTVITVETAKLDETDTYKIKVGAASLPLPGSTAVGYTNWNGTDEIDAAAGTIIVVAEVNASGKVVAAGYVESVPKTE